MANGPPSYAATSVSTPLASRPPLSTHRSSSSDAVARTKILLLGLRRAGKTSIQQVLFNNLPPKQTFYLETTLRIVKHTFDTVIPLEIWDCPGNTSVETLGAPLSQFATMIFVIDIRRPLPAQDLYNQPISRLVEFIVAAYQANPNIALEVFVHKAEKLQEDDKIGASANANPRRPLPTTPPPTTSSTSSLSDRTPPPGTSAPNGSTQHSSGDLFYPSASTSLHPSTPGTTLTYHLVTPQLALLALLPTSVYEGRRGLIEYNVVFFREGVREISQAETEARAAG
ncbi:hypothetical protein DXG03_001687 [Asterophora parasitica]|uniref:GTP-binding protein n=1 Tax=Asterophora parasitica TaxID=117018 RepID=A0A9P7KEZ4_9AGAR|nr:hypothetical protein DXG03_001687 [Asterophora parasitica]